MEHVVTDTDQIISGVDTLYFCSTSFCPILKVNACFESLIFNIFRAFSRLHVSIHILIE